MQNNQTQAKSRVRTRSFIKQKFDFNFSTDYSNLVIKFDKNKKKLTTCVWWLRVQRWKIDMNLIIVESWAV